LSDPQSDPHTDETEHLIEVRLPVESLSEEDRKQIADQARALRSQYRFRYRETINGVLLGIEISALYGGREMPTFGGSHSPADPTAPPDHHRDDVGTLMARVAALMDADETRPAVRRAWGKVLADLAHERDRVGTGP
jgi:hypothetical protein